MTKPQNVGRRHNLFPIIVYKHNNIWYNAIFFWGYGLLRITGLKLHNFRNYQDLEQPFEPGLTVLTGLNGAGKTNVLEAIFLCALGRSHRTSRDAELIKMGEMEGMVLLNLTTRGGSRSIREELVSGERKRIFLDGAPVARSGELMGCLNVVMFSPEDLVLVKGGPAERRRFMDMEISQLKPAYYYDLQQYNQALKQRNNLLKEGLETAGDMLELWDEQLSRLGARIVVERAAFCRELKELAGELHDHMSSGKEELRVEYEPNVLCADEELIREAIADALVSNLDRDLFRGFTSAGPHRDDLLLELNGTDVRTYGSQGQQRTTALSLKLSEIALIERLRQEKPVLLLDDVFSELDEGRRSLLLSAIDGCQGLITCTHLSELGPGQDQPLQVFRAGNGRLIEV